MERLIGYDAVVLVDAAQTGRAAPGTVHTFPLETLTDPARGHLSSSHETTLGTALEVGRRIGLSLPGKVEVVAIEVRVTNEFSEELTPAVEAAMPAAGEAVLAALRRLR
jgi:hydrogenase maturation protease